MDLWELSANKRCTCASWLLGLTAVACCVLLALQNDAAGEESLWDPALAIPTAAELHQIEGVEFHVIKQHEPEADQFDWLHGIALAWHNEQLFASYGHNQGKENTYLIGNTTRDARNRRWPLTIAVTTAGGSQFVRVFRIRDAIHAGPGESHPNASLSYPYAIERDGKLYVAYSNNGGRGANRNSAELAVIPLLSLAVNDEHPERAQPTD